MKTLARVRENATQTAPVIVSTSMPRACKFGLAAALCAAAFCPAAHALERITLTNGFSIDCASHEQADTDHVRIIYATGTQLLPASEIVSIDVLPDPPKPAPASAVVTVAASDIPSLIAHAGAQRNIDVDLLNSVINTESGFHTNAVSRTGARGLMQLMPKTARDLGVEDAFKPDQNIAGGAAYLDQLLTRYHDDLSLALAAYNAGPQAVDRYHGIPPFRETRAYVAIVERDFVRRKNALKKSATPKPATSEQATNEVPPVEPVKTVEASR
jgi:Transglycosylase SLT domain